MKKVIAMTLMSLSTVFGTALHADETRVLIRVRDEVLTPVSDGIFGHFMERAGFSKEPGYDAEAARDQDNPHALKKAVVEKMQWLDIPLIRFPAGADLPRVDWRDMIDNVPGRAGDRPPFKGKNQELTNNFGLDEFLALCEALQCEALIPFRLHQSVFRNRSLEKEAQLAAAMVAYCNAPVGAELPEGMEDWPAIRKQNGRAEPWDVKYVQIGNESWHYYKYALKKHGLQNASVREKADHYIESVLAIAEAIHRIDPDVKLIVDGVTGAGRWVDQQILQNPKIREHASFFSVHLYLPWGYNKILKDKEKISPAELTEEDLWNCAVAVPAINRQTGQSRAPYWPDWWLCQEMDVPLAITEWNWNGWWSGKKPRPAISKWAQGVGAAGILHAFMRRGDLVKVACQSMLLGERWGITSIRVSEDEEGARLFPTGMVTGFYSRHHGQEQLATETLNVPYYEQPLRINSIAPNQRVAELDTVVTRDEGKLYVHCINRRFKKETDIQIALEDLLKQQPSSIKHRLLTCKEDGKTPMESVHDIALPELKDNALEPVMLTLPPQSISIIEIAMPKP